MVLRILLWLSGLALTFGGWMLFVGWRRFEGSVTLGVVGMALGLIILGAAVWPVEGKWHATLTLFGASLLILALAIAVFTPQMVNNGSGQDAVVIAVAVVTLFVVATATLLCLVGGIIAFLK